jgi:hypothetical protein
MKGDTNMSTEIKKAAKAPEAKKPEVKKPEAPKAEAPKAEVKAPEVKKADISILLTKIPDTFTPALLDKLFNLNDGGKTVRRHLRKNFAEPVGHSHKEKWTFTKAQTDVLQYFADRYAFDLKVLEPAQKTA